jgi:hypothetical protein
VVLNKAFNDAVHVARAFSSLPKLADEEGVNLPQSGLIRKVRKAFNFLPIHRIFHSVEFTMFIALFGGMQGSLMVALWIALFVTVGHVVAITTSSKLRNEGVQR